jgi:hypothetical protein
LEQDKRGWRIDRTNTFSVSNLYKLTNWSGVRHFSADSIWRCAAPKEGKLFASLLIRSRLKVRIVFSIRKLWMMRIVLLVATRQRETVEHLALECGQTIHILALLGINLTNIEELKGI